MEPDLIGQEKGGRVLVLVDHVGGPQWSLTSSVRKRAREKRSVWLGATRQLASAWVVKPSWTSDGSSDEHSIPSWQGCERLRLGVSAWRRSSYDLVSSLGKPFSVADEGEPGTINTAEIDYHDGVHFQIHDALCI